MRMSQQKASRWDIDPPRRPETSVHGTDAVPVARSLEQSDRRVGYELGEPAGNSDVRHPLGQAEDSHRARQEAGLAALMGIAYEVSFGVSEAAKAVLQPLPTWLDDSVADRPVAPGAEADDGQPRSLLTRLRADHLVRNSLYLMLSSGVQAALGFTFWLLMARLFSSADIGMASSLISATSLIGFFALFGLNSTLVRFLPTSKDRNRLITAALLLVIGTGAAIGLFISCLPRSSLPVLRSSNEVQPSLSDSFSSVRRPQSTCSPTRYSSRAAGRGCAR